MDRRGYDLKTYAWLVIVGVGGALAGCRGDGLIGLRGDPPPGENTGGGGMTGNNPATPPAMPGGMNPARPPGAVNPGMPAAGVGEIEMPGDVLAILQGRCAGCHTYGQADPAGWGSVLDVSRMIASDIIVPGNPDASRLIDRIAVAGDMPPKGDRVPSGDVSILRKWIQGMRRGNPQPLSDTDILDEISVDQLRLRDRSSDYRYVSFAHFAGEGRSAKEMEAVRQVFRFVLNSLSRRGQIVDLPAIDEAQSIFRIRLSDLGWDEALWDTLTGFYPYCIKSDAVAHEGLYAQLRTEAPYVRGDWLMATATKAPLYDLLIDLPNTVDQLAARLGVDINDDINHPGLAEPDNLLRIGFRRSGVALNNRLLERHLGNQGQALWISYDFDSSQGRADLLANPLGPDDRDQQNFVHTFQHAGGEVIFTMPNGLQGYMVVDAAGRKIAEAPLNVVRDPRRRNGVVENGISCFGCHGAVGLIKPRETDEVPRYIETHIADFLGRELNEIEASYPRVLKPDVFATDSYRYRTIAETIEGGAPPLADGEYSSFVAMVGQYESNVGFRGAAAEFNELYDTFRERVLANDFQNDALPRTPTAPLVSREDFVCVWRDLVVKIRPNAIFCDNTFDAAAVLDDCTSSGRSNPNNPNNNNNNNNNNNRGTGGSSSSRGTGGSSNNNNSGAGGTGGSSNSGSVDAGAPPSDGGTDGQRCFRVDGRRVCR